MRRDLRRALPFVAALLLADALIYAVAYVVLSGLVKEDLAASMLALLIAYGTGITFLACLAIQRMDTNYRAARKTRREVARHG